MSANNTLPWYEVEPLVTWKLLIKIVKAKMLGALALWRNIEMSYSVGFVKYLRDYIFKCFTVIREIPSMLHFKTCITYKYFKYFLWYSHYFSKLRKEYNFSYFNMKRILATNYFWNHKKVLMVFIYISTTVLCFYNRFEDL